VTYACKKKGKPFRLGLYLKSYNCMKDIASSILRQVYPPHILEIYFRKINFNIIVLILGLQTTVYKDILTN
jgi:hypothetical protein